MHVHGNGGGVSVLGGVDGFGKPGGRGRPGSPLQASGGRLGLGNSASGCGAWVWAAGGGRFPVRGVGGRRKKRAAFVCRKEQESGRTLKANKMPQISKVLLGSSSFPLLQTGEHGDLFQAYECGA